MGKISSYTRALVAKLQDVFVVDQTDNNVTATKSVTVEQIGDTIAGTQTHSTLNTSSKTLIGAINEVAKDKNIADEYDSTHTYNTGDITIHDNTLYVCQDDNVTGAWDSTKWSATTVDDLIPTNDNNLPHYSGTPTEGTTAYEIAITDITSSFLTYKTGYSYVSGAVYKQGKHIFGNLVIQASSALPSTNDTVNVADVAVDYRPSVAINGFCGMSTGQWFTNSYGYVYIGGTLAAATPMSGNIFIKVSLNYATA